MLYGTNGQPQSFCNTKKDLWNLWRSGQSLSEIRRAREKNPGSIYWIISAKDGIVQQDHKRSLLQLKLEESEEISRELAKKLSIRQIDQRLNRSPSTISREVERNGGIEKYRATKT